MKYRKCCSEAPKVVRLKDLKTGDVFYFNNEDSAWLNMVTCTGLMVRLTMYVGDCPKISTYGGEREVTKVSATVCVDSEE